MHAHTPIRTHSQELVTHWFWWTVCKASPCTDKQKISSDRYFSRCLLLGQRRAFISKSMPTLPAYVGVSMPLWSPLAEHSCKVSRVHQFVAFFHCKAVWCILGSTTRSVIYLHRWWNIHFPEKHIQLVPVNETFATIRPWHTLVRFKRASLQHINYDVVSTLWALCSQRSFFPLFLLGMIHCYQIDRHSSNFQIFSHKRFYILESEKSSFDQFAASFLDTNAIVFEVWIALVLLE